MIDRSALIATVVLCSLVALGSLRVPLSGVRAPLTPAGDIVLQIAPVRRGTMLELWRSVEPAQTALQIFAIMILEWTIKTATPVSAAAVLYVN